MRPLLDDLSVWLESTRVSAFMNWSPWAWPANECLHFIGLALLLGTVGLYDLRLLGLARGLSLRAMEKLVRWGIGGFLLSLTTGALFITGIPSLYFTNAAFRAKVVLLLLAGVNLIVFKVTMAKRVAALDPDENPPVLARVLGGVSLVLWVGVLLAGRYIGFFKP